MSRPLPAVMKAVMMLTHTLCARRRLGRRAGPGLPEVLADERGHLFERLLGRRRGEIAQQPFALALEDGQVDLAPSLAVLSHELIEVRARMPRLVRASQAQCGR